MSQREAILQAFDALGPEAKNKEIMEHATKLGVKITPGYISVIRHEVKKKNNLSEKDLLLAKLKKLTDEFGFESVRRNLDLLEKFTHIIKS